MALQSNGTVDSDVVVTYRTPGTMEVSTKTYAEQGWTEFAQAEKTELFMSVVREHLGKFMV